MKLTINRVQLPIFFKYILQISLIEVLLFYFLQFFFGFNLFQVVPYIRVVILIYTFYFVLSKKLLKTSVFKSVSIANTLENKLVLFWISISVLALFIGLISLNPLFHTLFDFIYILVGYFIFRVFLVNGIDLAETNDLLNLQYIKRFGLYACGLGVLGLVLHSQLPSFFIIFCISLAFFLFKKKAYFYSLLLLIPFFLQILFANRALLIVLFIVLFITWRQGKFSKKNVLSFFTITFFILVLLSIILDDILYLALKNLEAGSVLSNRLAQIYNLLKGNVDWNLPQYLSLYQRYAEAKQVVIYWLSNPFRFIFGGGMGGTIDGSAFKDAGVTTGALYGKQDVHNIHIILFSLILRYGLFGILLFLFLVHVLIRYFFEIIMSEVSMQTTIMLFVFCWILYSFPAASYLWTCPVFWISLSYLSKWEKQIK